MGPDDPATGLGRFWGPEDLGGILRHQLSASAESELSASAIDRAGDVHLALRAIEAPAVWSLGGLLAHPRPPSELLVLVKRLAQDHLRRPDSPLPQEVAHVLYYASILAGLKRCGARIGKLDDAALAKGARWALACPWIDAPVRAVFEEGLRGLGQTTS